MVPSKRRPVRNKHKASRKFRKQIQRTKAVNIKGLARGGIRL